MAEQLPPPPVPPDADRDDQREAFVPFRDLAKKLVAKTLRKYLDHAVNPKSVKH
jgi:hypothetical protein